MTNENPNFEKCHVRRRERNAESGLLWDSALHYRSFSVVTRGPARLAAGLVVLTTDSRGFSSAAKRLAVLLLAIWVGRGWRELYTLEIMLQNRRNDDKKHCRESATESPPERPRDAYALRPA